MKLFPAIDIKDGRAVRLFKGDYDKMTVYSSDPAAVAKTFAAGGARHIHLVDLDGARDGGTPNAELIERIVKGGALSAQVGGGIRAMETLERYLSAGAERVVIGTAAVKNPDFLKAAVEKYGESIAVGVDAREGMVAIQGWTQSGGVSCFDFCARLEALGVKTVICTDISRDGAMRGPNVELYAELKKRFSMDVIASGGVTVLGDLKRLAEAGADGAILGKSLYAGTIDLREAVRLFGKAEA